MLDINGVNVCCFLFYKRQKNTTITVCPKKHILVKVLDVPIQTMNVHQIEQQHLYILVLACVGLVVWIVYAGWSTWHQHRKETMMNAYIQNHVRQTVSPTTLTDILSNSSMVARTREQLISIAA